MQDKPSALSIRATPALRTSEARGRDVTSGELARAAAGGDERAWTEIVHQFDAVLHGVAKSYRLSPADVDEVVQAAWLRAVDHIEQLNVHEAIAGWLVVIARREAMRILQRRTREIVTDSVPEPRETDVPSAEDVIIRQELDELVRGAVNRLPGRQQRVIDSILRCPSSSYRQLASQLDMPVGAIGPTRGRALARLGNDDQLQALATA